jgi:hypothetical protein
MLTAFSFVERPLYRTMKLPTLSTLPTFWFGLTLFQSSNWERVQAQLSKAVPSDENYAPVKFWDLLKDIEPPIEDKLGGMKFRSDGTKMCIVTGAEAGDGAIYCMDVIRNSTSGQILNFANATKIANFSYLDLGFSPGPGGKDFFNIFDSDNETYAYGHGLLNMEGESPTFTVDHTFSSEYIDPEEKFYIAEGVEFSPVKKDNRTDYGMMFAGSGGGIWQFPLSYNTTTGNYNPVADEIVRLCALDEAYIGDMRYIPSGKYYNDLLYVSYDNSVANILELDDDTGNPIHNVTGVSGVNITLPRLTEFTAFETLTIM